MLPGGFSGGDEPDGSAKFITAFFRNPAVTDAVRDLLNNRDGLMLGICNGFQAIDQAGPGALRRHRADDRRMPDADVQHHRPPPEPLVRTRVASNLSPWLSEDEVGDAHHRHLPRRRPFRGFNDDLLAPADQGQRPDRHAVCGRGWRAGHGYAM